MQITAKIVTRLASWSQKWLQSIVDGQIYDGDDSIDYAFMGSDPNAAVHSLHDPFVPFATGD